MPRKPADTESIKVTLPGGLVKVLDDLVAMGLFGATRAQVIQTFARNEIERLVVKEAIFERKLGPSSDSQRKEGKR
ncbi:MAG: hypothetical protein E6Q76_05305 [Rhizobium sp.]|nr:MAG: hypothetical protein E6Q76_05305 [Rhizobium sp.]